MLIACIQRTAWAPFFDDVDAIIFLAPLNCFDERLVEDPRVNRLQDSYELWKAVVSNKILNQTQIILFLNKYDLLKKKLERGVKVKNYVPSYGGRDNTSEAVVKCKFFHFSFSLSSSIEPYSCTDFEQHFREVFKKYSPQARPFYLHVTSVVVRPIGLAMLCLSTGIDNVSFRIRKQHERRSA